MKIRQFGSKSLEISLNGQEKAAALLENSENSKSASVSRKFRKFTGLDEVKAPVFLENSKKARQIQKIHWARRSKSTSVFRKFKKSKTNSENSNSAVFSENSENSENSN